MPDEDLAARDFRWLLIIALLAAGTTLVLVGWRLNGYWSSVLLELGAALFIAMPLIFIERLMRRRFRIVKSEVEDVRREVQDTQTRIEDLGARTSELIDAARVADASSVEALRAYASERSTWTALRRAIELGAVDDRGVRVRLPGATTWVRFTASSDPGFADIGFVQLHAEDRGGDAFAGEEWAADEPPEQALARLGREMQSAGRYPGDASYDAVAIFKDLADTLQAVVQVRTSEEARGEPLGAVIEVVGDWAVTAWGLEHVRDVNRRVGARELLDSLERARAELLADEHEGDDKFSEAIETARSYHSGADRRRARERVPRR